MLNAYCQPLLTFSQVRTLHAWIRVGILPKMFTCSRFTTLHARILGNLSHILLTVIDK